MSEYETHGFCGIIKKPYTHRELGEALNGVISWASQRSSGAEGESRRKAIPLRKRSEVQEMSRTV